MDQDLSEYKISFYRSPKTGRWVLEGHRSTWPRVRAHMTMFGFHIFRTGGPGDSLIVWRIPPGRGLRILKCQLIKEAA